MRQISGVQIFWRHLFFVTQPTLSRYNLEMEAGDPNHMHILNPECVRWYQPHKNLTSKIFGYGTFVKTFYFSINFCAPKLKKSIKALCA